MTILENSSIIIRGALPTEDPHSRSASGLLALGPGPWAQYTRHRKTDYYTKTDINTKTDSYTKTDIDTKTDITTKTNINRNNDI